MRSPSASIMVRDLGIERSAALLCKRICRAVDSRDALSRIVEKHCPATAAWIRACYHDPTARAFSRREVVLAALDEIIGTCGVEALGPSDNDPHYVPRYSYLNTGDSYAATLVYKRDTDHIYVSSWGTIAERLPGGEES